MERAHKKGHPPILGATSALYPHNFSHHKNRKKFAQEDIIFRTKNPEKSRLGLIGKNFGKNLRENVSGEKESPQSCGKGARGAKI